MSFVGGVNVLGRQTAIENRVRYSLNGEYGYCKYFSDAPSGATSIKLNYMYFGYLTYLEANQTNANLDNINHTVIKVSKTINDITYDLYPRQRIYGYINNADHDDIRTSAYFAVIRNSSDISTSSQPITTLAENFLVKYFLSNSNFNSIISTMSDGGYKFYTYSTYENVSITKASNTPVNNDIYSGFFSFPITKVPVGKTQKSKFTALSTAILDYIVNNRTSCYFDTVSNTITIADNGAYNVANFITLLISPSTKKYTNSTWNTSKTWYIKVTFSKNKASNTHGGSNVVNYETSMLR